FASHCCSESDVGPKVRDGIFRRDQDSQPAQKAGSSSRGLFYMLRGLAAYKLRGGAEYGLKPAFSIPRCASGFFMNVSHTNPDRAFSAISIVIPVSMPITSVSYQSLRGLKASMKPYRDHAWG